MFLSQVDSGVNPDMEYRQGFFSVYGSLKCLVLESDGCHSGILEQFFLQPVEIGNPWSNLRVFENGGRGTPGLIKALHFQ